MNWTKVDVQVRFRIGTRYKFVGLPGAERDTDDETRVITILGITLGGMIQYRIERQGVFGSGTSIGETPLTEAMFLVSMGIWEWVKPETEKQTSGWHVHPGSPQYECPCPTPGWHVVPGGWGQKVRPIGGS